MPTRYEVAARKRRHLRVRRKIAGSAERPRLAVFRSNKHTYAQLIDDRSGRTLASASTLDGEVGGGSPAEAAKQIGLTLGRRAQQAGITTAVFDRGGFAFHGRVKQVADGAREAGLTF